MQPGCANQNEISAIVALVEARLNQLEALTRNENKPIDRIVGAVQDAEKNLLNLKDSRLNKLLALFHCRVADRAVLLTCLAAAIEPRLASRYAEIQGRPWVTESLVTHLFGLGYEAPVSPSSAIMIWRLVTVRELQLGEPRCVQIDPEIKEWLFGRISIETQLLGGLQFVDCQDPLSGWPVENIANKLEAAVGRGERAVVVVEGLRGSGRATFAANSARLLGQRCVVVDPGATTSSWSDESTLLAHRFALVSGSVLVWRNCESRHLMPRGCWPAPIQGLTIESGTPPPPTDDFATYSVSIPAMSSDERRQLLLSNVPSSSTWQSRTLQILTERRTLTPGEIRRLARIAPESDDEAIAAANQSHSSLMGELARCVTANIGWDDLILPGFMRKDLQDLAFECRARADLWSRHEVQRLFKRERGLLALFQGPPGTGKTMTAQVIANENNTDLFRVDSASITSKYIGETSKALRRIFAKARRVDSILFFDEADALFAKRTDIATSHDRHANSDTSYLLQLVEDEFDGFAILASNRTSDMDSAFLRRIRYVFDFPRPSAEQREEIWRRSAVTLFDEQRYREMHDLWPLLADCLDITGAQIKTTLLSAYFYAYQREDRIKGQDILRAAEREFAKEGRAIGTHEKQRILSYA